MNNIKFWSVISFHTVCRRDRYSRVDVNGMGSHTRIDIYTNTNTLRFTYDGHSAFMWMSSCLWFPALLSPLSSILRVRLCVHLHLTENEKKKSFTAFSPRMRSFTDVPEYRNQFAIMTSDQIETFLLFLFDWKFYDTNYKIGVHIKMGSTRLFRSPECRSFDLWSWLTQIATHSWRGH